MRFYYSNTIEDFISQSFDVIWSHLTSVGRGDLLQTQKQAWVKQIKVLKNQLEPYKGNIYFEYSIPRMGKRIDAILLVDGIIFVLEFKVGAKEFHRLDVNQVWDYALDLKYFHEESHHLPIIPILISTETKDLDIVIYPYDDMLTKPILSNGGNLSEIIRQSLFLFPKITIDNYLWSISRYAPTPTYYRSCAGLV